MYTAREYAGGTPDRGHVSWMIAGAETPLLHYRDPRGRMPETAGSAPSGGSRIPGPTTPSVDQRETAN
jgi:hypothetical protein